MDTATLSSDGRTLLAKTIREKTTQAQFAREVDCSESHLSLVLAGERGVSLKLAKRISKKSGIPIRKLRPDLAELFG